MRNEKLLVVLLVVGMIIIMNRLSVIISSYQTYTQLQSQAIEQIKNYKSTDWYKEYWSKFPDAIQALKEAGYDPYDPINKLTLMKLEPDENLALTPQFLNDLHLSDDSYVTLIKIDQHYLPTEIHAHIYTDGKTYTIRSLKAFVNIDLTFTHNEFPVKNNWIILKFVYPLNTFITIDQNVKTIIYQQGIFIDDERLERTTFDVRVYLKVSDRDENADNAGILVYETTGRFLYTPTMMFLKYNREFIASLTPRAWSGLVVTGKDFMKKLTPKYVTIQEYFTKERIIEILREMQTTPRIEYMTIQPGTIKINTPFYKTITQIRIRQGAIYYLINETTLLIYTSLNGENLIIYKTKNNIIKLPTPSHNTTITTNLTLHALNEIELYSKDEILREHNTRHHSNQREKTQCTGSLSLS
ncbi:MAG: hypothetical protein ACP5GU_04505 [Thermoprotei archaeon]